MGCVRIVLAIHAIVFASFGLMFWGLLTNRFPPMPEKPQVEAKWFGPGERQQRDTGVRKFKIEVKEPVLQDLKKRLESDLQRLQHQPLEDSAFTYGYPSTEVRKLATYWLNEYNWRGTEALLNSFPHFKTDIDGIDVHFIHAKPDPKLAKGKKVVPLLLVHGWPGSVIEFVKLIPKLTKPSPEHDFVFEVIAPSIPGYGWSSAPAKKGFNAAQCARIFKRLMQERLGFKKFYMQGGDWGSLITTNLATLYPESALGLHLNMAAAQSPAASLIQVLSAYVPAGWLVDKNELHKILPLGEKFSYLMSEMGYLHIQATKPDTVGVALSVSPLGLATYIVEKFSTWTNKEYRNYPDGGLTQKFTYTELLDNVMIYWVTNSITSSMRFYAENIDFSEDNMNIIRIPIEDVPTGIVNAAHEIALMPKAMLDTKFKMIYTYNDIDVGGHFLAYEEPQILANDVWAFVELVEYAAKNKNKKSSGEL